MSSAERADAVDRALPEQILTLLDREEQEGKEYRHRLLNAVQTIFSSVEILQVTPGLAPAQLNMLQGLEAGVEELEMLVKHILEGRTKFREALSGASTEALQSAKR